MADTMQGPCTSRVCMVGLNVLHFPPSRTVHCFAVVFALFLTSWISFYSVWRHVRSPRVRCLTAGVIITAWGAGWYWLQPRYPYWINELSATTYVMSTWHLLDWVLLRLHEPLPATTTTASLLLDDALVLRPHVMRHRAGHRRPSGSTWGRKVQQALPSLGLFVVQYCGCEAINAWLMQQSTEDVLHGPLPYRMVASLSFAMALYLHLSYFYHSMCALNILVFDSTPEDWPPVFKAPWGAASPTEFWNERWHQMFRWWFTRLVFNPTRACMKRLVTAPSSRPEAKHTQPPTQPHTQPHTQQGSEEDSINTPSRGKARSRAAMADVAGVGVGVTPRRSVRLQAVAGQAATSVTAATGLHDSDKVVAPANGSTLQHKKNGRSSSGVAHTPVANGHSTPGGTAAPAMNGHSSAGHENGHGSGGGGDGAPQAAHQQRGGTDHPLVLAVPLMAVFFASGCFHELMLTLFFGAPTGEQMAFFLLHGLAVLLDKAWQRAHRRRRHGNDGSNSSSSSSSGGAMPRWVGVALFNTFLVCTTLLFIRPWFRYHYHLELRVPVPGPVHWTVADLTRHRPWLGAKAP